MENINNELLRFTTAGSVDDGKSTLIGRLLYDSKALFEDQIDSIQSASERKGMENIDLALFTDGLRDEREQGITIDVAYRYFTTPKRKFIIADTPGHIQYTRNMITGASTANVALILIDARKGVIEQTKRHSYIASLLNIPHVIVCVNKMDLVDWDQEKFDSIVTQYKGFAEKLTCKDVQFIPMSALLGDNVVNASENMSWFKGKSLLDSLETIEITNDINKDDTRFPIQTVIRPQTTEFHDFRGYVGKLSTGTLKKGDAIVALPSNLESTVDKIYVGDKEVEEAFAPMSINVTLTDDIDVSRGDMIVNKDNQPEMSQDLEVMLCWMNEKAARPRAKYYLKQTTTEYKAVIKEVEFKVDINTYDKDDSNKDLAMNDIAKVKIRTTQPVVKDKYLDNRSTGSLILIDEITNETVAAGMII